MYNYRFIVNLAPKVDSNRLNPKKEFLLLNCYSNLKGMQLGLGSNSHFLNTAPKDIIKAL